MSRALLALLFVLSLPVLAAPDAGASASEREAPRQFLRARHGNLALTQLYADGFLKLAPAERKVAWHLTLASHAGHDIHFDQLGWNNLAVKRLLEGVYLFGLEPRDGDFTSAFTDYFTRFLGNVGNHDATTGQKFVPTFAFETLRAAARRALAQGADFGVKDEAALDTWLGELRPALFEASYESQLTAKSPPPGKDLLTASSNTLYGKDVSLKDLDGFTEKNALNSRVVRTNGKLEEQVFRMGTPDGKVAPGIYANELTRVVAHLEGARKHAPADQRDALGKLVRYLQTGSLRDWDAYNIAWLRANPRVDANLGFIETYVDARGQKGEWEALIHFADPDDNRVMALLAQKAQHFEDRMPWPDRYKRKGIRTPVAKAIHLVASHPQPPSGINLPNEQHIREKHGSKSVLVMNTMETMHHVLRGPLDEEFLATPEERESSRQYGADAPKLLVAFHEVLGHASGKVDARLKGNPSSHLKEFDNTLEEARADLVALWHVWDPLVEKAGFGDVETLGKEMYRSFLAEGLSNLRKVESGDRYEEDHQRGHHMTLGFLVERGAAEYARIGGKTYLRVKDYVKMREAVGELLTKLMVIKATGDYAGIRALVEKHGIRFDPKLRDEVVARVKAANLPTLVLMSPPVLQPVLEEKAGALTDVRLSNEWSFLDAQLLGSLLGRLRPDEATAVAARVTGSPEAMREELRVRHLQARGKATGGSGSSERP